MSTIQRDKRMSSGAFTGDHYIVSKTSGLAIESWRVLERAEKMCEALNVHNEKNGHAERFEVKTEGSSNV